jgi:hypothetical protein
MEALSRQRSLLEGGSGSAPLCPSAGSALVQRLALGHPPLIGTGQPVELVDEAAHVSDLTGLSQGMRLDRLKQLLGSNLDGVSDEVAHRDRVADRDALEPRERLRDIPRDAQPDHRHFPFSLSGRHIDTTRT